MSFFVLPLSFDENSPKEYLDIVEVIYDSRDVLITLSLDEQQETLIKVKFKDVEGFRVLNESDIGSFWSSECSLQIGWIYEVKSGGWLALESTRDDFLSAGNEDL